MYADVLCFMIHGLPFQHLLQFSHLILQTPESTKIYQISFTQIIFYVSVILGGINSARNGFLHST